jgi:cytochrome c5
MQQEEVFPMNRSIASLYLLWLLAGCAENGNGELPQVEPQPAAMDSALEIGRRAYEDICAGCHDEGINGAPKTGDRAAWENRSWLWEGVLFEHARTGFNEMPAKGGDSQLDEATVTKAAEYMMSLTYPEMPRD